MHLTLCARWVFAGDDAPGSGQQPQPMYSIAVEGGTLLQDESEAVHDRSGAVRSVLH